MGIIDILSLKFFGLVNENIGNVLFGVFKFGVGIIFNN